MFRTYVRTCDYKACKDVFVSLMFSFLFFFLMSNDTFPIDIPVSCVIDLEPRITILEDDILFKMVWTLTNWHFKLRFTKVLILALYKATLNKKITKFTFLYKLYFLRSIF